MTSPFVSLPTMDEFSNFSIYSPILVIVFLYQSVQFCSVIQSCPMFCDPWTAAHQASLSITNSQSLLKFIFICDAINHLILCRPLPLPPSIIPSIRVFSSESILYIRWPKYWPFSFSISPSNGFKIDFI